MRMTSVIVLLAAGALAFLPQLAPAAIVPVSIINFTYSPDTAQITQGDSVVWTNNGTHPHTTTSGAGGIYDSLWDSGTLSVGGTFGHKFLNVGSFPYFCRIHYPMNGMSGVITVRSSGIGDESHGKADAVSLLSVQPNPVRSAAQVTYSVSVTSRVALKLYDVTGKLVRTLAVGLRSPGVYSEHVIRSSGLGAGVYLLRLNACNRSDCRQVVIE